MLKIIKVYALCVIVFFYSCKADDPNTKVEYHRDGTVKFIKRYNEGILNGQSQWFYENGNLEQTVLFKAGKEYGNAYYFYPSGALKNFRYWREGKMVGYVADYYDDTVGIIKSVLLYDDGRLIYKKNFDSLGRFINEEGNKPGW